MKAKCSGGGGWETTSLGPLPVVVCVARKPRPCLSYSRRRRDGISSVLLRFADGSALGEGPGPIQKEPPPSLRPVFLLICAPSEGRRLG